ncbi:hypothetical protein [Mesobacillus foraminis]|uniref:Uncharacterized protein n=1 Tax=Mesobacillus foraminis TaxID=279826 RepID=A0A4R2BKZ5_9BACI|nr:hypothetical protein [Mesobacillus foraminis]TCN27212.1 hypothetical protein EV146_102158 [Mesobacillus foraminis]
MKQTFEYSQIHYNEAIYHLEQKWGRRLNEHERHVLIEGYKFGRLVESENHLAKEFLFSELERKSI